MWIRRRDPASEHRCAPPTREATYTLPPALASSLPITHTETVVDGFVGDLWRCETCGALWCATWACDHCDRFGRGPHRGICWLGMRWRPASWWTRLRYLRAGRGAR